MTFPALTLKNIESERFEDLTVGYGQLLLSWAQLGGGHGGRVTPLFQTVKI